METSPLYQVQAKLEIGDLIVLSPGTNQSTVGYLKSPINDHWLNPGNLKFILSQTDPNRGGKVRDYLLGIESKFLGSGVLAQKVSRNQEVQIVQPAAESQSRDKQKDLPLTGVDIGDVVLLSAENLQAVGHVHELGQRHIILGYRYPDEAPIWLRKYDLSKFYHYQNLSPGLK